MRVTGVHFVEPPKGGEVVMPAREVFAPLNGLLRARLSVVPKRLQRDGQWADDDSTLAAGVNSVAPRATEAGLTFSNGGTVQPLVRLVKGDKAFALTWPGELPTPALDGLTRSGLDKRIEEGRWE